MLFIRRIPSSQYNAAKTISVLKELFSEHGIPETIRSDNGLQFASHQFTEFTKEWNFDHTTSSPRNPRNNGQAKAAVKVTKGLLTHAKYTLLSLEAIQLETSDFSLCLWEAGNETGSSQNRGKVLKHSTMLLVSVSMFQF